MRKSKLKPDHSWPSWWYGPNGESAIFQCQEEVPGEWARKPFEPVPEIPKPPVEILDREDLIRQLVENNVDVNHIWSNAHMKRILDGDISSTG